MTFCGKLKFRFFRRIWIALSWDLDFPFGKMVKSISGNRVETPGNDSVQLKNIYTNHKNPLESTK